MLSGGFKIEGYDDFTFRFKKMNAFEALGLRTQLKFDSAEDAENMFKKCLEYIEVECKNVWLSCKEKNAEVYAPACLEEDANLLQELVMKFMNEYFYPLFIKSGE